MNLLAITDNQMNDPLREKSARLLQNTWRNHRYTSVYHQLQRKAFSKLSGISDLFYQVAKFLTDRVDIKNFSLSCKNAYKAVSLHHADFINRRAWKNSIKWAYLHKGSLVKDIQNASGIPYTFEQKISKGWYLCDFGKDQSNEELNTSQAQKDLSLFLQHVTQKSDIKVFDCSRVFFLQLLQLPLHTLKASSVKHPYEGTLTHFPLSQTLTKLDIKFTDLNDHVVIALAETLKTNCILLILKLSHNSIKENGAQAIATAISINRTLKELDLSSNFIGLKGIVGLTEALAYNNSTLEVLNINHIGVPGFSEPESYVALCRMLIHNRTLRKIDLGSNDFSDHVEGISFALALNNGLKELDLFCARGKWTWRDYSMIIRNPQLESLYILSQGETANSSIDFGSFADVLKSNRSLKKLNIYQSSRNKNNGIDLKSISIASQIGKNLQKLTLTNGLLNIEGIQSLAESIIEGLPISDLDLSNNKLKADSFKVLAKAISTSSFLKNLHLSDNQGKNEGAEAIANALVENKRVPIETVDLSENNIAADGAEAFGRLIGANKKTLKHVILHHPSGWTKESGYEALIKGLLKNEFLQFLDISHSNSDERLRNLLAKKRWLNVRIYQSFRCPEKNPSVW